MLDGMLIGTPIEGNIEIKGSEVRIMKKLLIKAGAEEREGGLCLTIDNKSNMVVALRTHYHNKSLFFLNVSGNPLNFIKGSNVWGYAEADRVIVKAYKMILDTLGEVPHRIVDSVIAREINIHSLEFATYTCEVPNKKKLLSDWAYMYRTADTLDIRSEEHEGLCDMLNIKFLRLDKKHKSSVCLRILSKDGREEEAMLETYDKALAIRELAEKVGEVGVVHSDIESRLRLDLNLNQGWFRRRQVNGKKIKTLNDLSEYVKKNHDGKWHEFIANEYQWALDRTKLFYMWSFDASEALVGNNPIMNAMMISRALIKARDKQKMKLIKNKGVGKLTVCLDPHPEKLILDTGIV